MATHDYVIDNQTAPNFRADLNNALLAIVSNNSNATPPAVTYANMIWYDTATNILFMRNEDNDAFIRLGTLDQTADTFAAAVTLASQAEAQAGTDNTKVMTPLRVAQAIDSLSSSGSLLSTQVFTASGTYNRSAGVSTVLMFVTGGGGGGGSDANREGGGGATAIRFLNVASIASATITVGAGGLSSGSLNTAGGFSRWVGGVTVTANGGGTGESVATATGGNLNLPGSRSRDSNGATFWGFSKRGKPAVFGHGGDRNDLGEAGVVWVLEFA